MSSSSLLVGNTSTAVRPSMTDFDLEPVSLETDIENTEVQREALLRAWVELYPNSVEAALANQSDLLEFGNTHCLFFAAILWSHRIKPSQRSIPSPNFWPAWPEEPLPLAPGATLPDGDPHPSAVEDTTEVTTENEAAQNGDTIRVCDTVGVVYIASSPLPSQVHIGVGVLSTFRNKGIGRRACEIALGWAIDILQMHRVQARILPSPHQHRTRSLFAALGLVHEGVHRRAVMSPSGEWADVAHMGVLDTDWHIRARLQSEPKSLWDELLGRHQREVDEMLRFEERQRHVRRTSSMETIRVAPDPDPIPEWQGRGRPVCTPSGPSIASSSPSSRASSHASDASDAGADMRYRSETPHSPRSDAEDLPRFAYPRRERFFDSVRETDTPQSPSSDSEPIPRPPSSASSSSYASVGSFSSLPRRSADAEDEDWVSLDRFDPGGSVGGSFGRS